MIQNNEMTVCDVCETDLVIIQAIILLIIFICAQSQSHDGGGITKLLKFSLVFKFL